MPDASYKKRRAQKQSPTYELWPTVLARNAAVGTAIPPHDPGLTALARLLLATLAQGELLSLAERFTACP